MRSSHSLTRKLSLQAQSPVDHKTNCKAQMILFTGYKKDIIIKRNKLLDKLLDHSEVTLIVRSKTYLHFCFLKANSLINFLCSKSILHSLLVSFAGIYFTAGWCWAMCGNWCEGIKNMFKDNWLQEFITLWFHETVLWVNFTACAEHNKEKRVLLYTNQQI